MSQVSKRHHWWPEAVSQHWTDQDGFINWLRPDGQVLPLSPGNAGVIGHGHSIKLGRDAAEASLWDTSFEKEFDRADTHFPGVIDWLEKFEKRPISDAPIADRFLGVKALDTEISLLVEGLVSLAVRSPMTRESAVGLAEDLRGPLPTRERNTLIGLNIRHLQRLFVSTIGTSGKFVVIYSADREFIFGDGFFHNFTSMIRPAIPKILAPLTPRIAVLYARPMSYLTNPRISTISIRAEETDGLNLAVQVYARNALYYRQERPNITEHFEQGKHLRFSTSDNPVDRLVESIPGARPQKRIFGL
jgi:hypothetical protein